MRIDDEFCKRLPLKPSQELIDFVNAKPKFNIQCLIYRVGYENGKKVAMCKCTACGQEFSQEWISKENCPQTYSSCTFGFRNSLTNEAVCGKSITLCPHCESGVNVYHISDFGNHFARIQIAYEPFLTVEILDGALCLLSWSGSRCVHKNGTIENSVTASESNIYTKRNKKAITPYTSTGWHVFNKHRTAIDCVLSSNIFPFKDELLRGTDFENAKLEKYFFSGKAYPSLYAQLYRKYPQVENLVMTDLSFYLNDRLRAVCSSYYGHSIEQITGINFSEVKPSKMLGLTKDEIKEFIASKIEFHYLQFYQENKEQYSFSDIVSLRKIFTLYELERIKDDKENALQIARYLTKQKKYSSVIDYTYLRDYWKMLEVSNTAITAQNKFPHKLHNAHDSLSKCIEEKWLAFVKKLKEKENGKQKRVSKARNITAAGA